MSLFREKSPVEVIQRTLNCSQTPLFFHVQSFGYLLNFLLLFPIYFTYLKSHTNNTNIIGLAISPSIVLIHFQVSLFASPLIVLKYRQ